MVLMDIQSDATWHKKQEYMYIYGSGVGISMAFEIKGQFLFQGGRDYNLIVQCMVMTYIPSDAT
jgi:hypothetical protein